MPQVTTQPTSNVFGLLYADPRPRRWTRAEFYRMGDLGLFQGQRAELIEGEIMVMSPQNWPHSSTVDRAGEVLKQLLGGGVWVRTQLPLNLGAASDPEPDVSVVVGRRGDYTDHPTATLLVVEVSDTTLDYDRGRKASLYAQAGVADYWIVNLVDRQVEVYRQPGPDATQFYGHGFGSQSTYGPGDTIAPLAFPQIGIPVADLLP
jgi:Uma2 family endonuclease